MKDYGQLNNQGSEAYLTINKKKVPVQERDIIFLLEYLNGRWGFQTQWRIDGVKKGEAKTDIPERITVEMYLDERFEFRPLDNFVYTLSYIRNYKRPEKGFRLFRNLTPIEASMILRGKVDEVRSLIGFTFYNMHRDHRICFLEKLGLKDLRQEYVVYDEYELLNKMNEYVIDHIINPSEQFLESVKLFKKMFGDENYSKLSFSDDQNIKSTSYAINQENALKEYLENVKSNFGPFFRKRENRSFDKNYNQIRKSPLVLKVK